MYSWRTSFKLGCSIPPQGTHYLLSVLIFTWAAFWHWGWILGCCLAVLSQRVKGCTDGTRFWQHLFLLLLILQEPVAVTVFRRQWWVSSQLGAVITVVRSIPAEGRDVFCLFVSLFLWGGASSESLFLISSFPPLIFPQQLKQANRNK